MHQSISNSVPHTEVEIVYRPEKIDYSNAEDDAQRCSDTEIMNCVRIYTRVRFAQKHINATVDQL